MPKARPTLSAVLVVWLAMAFTPCAMAAAQDQHAHDCPHCPPIETRHELPCDVVVKAPCEAITQVNHDGRGADQNKFKDVPPGMAAASWGVATGSRLQRVLPRHHMPRGAAGPPLNVLHCVFLN